MFDSCHPVVCVGAYREVGPRREIRGCLLGALLHVGCQVLTQAFATTTDMLNAA